MCLEIKKVVDIPILQAYKQLGRGIMEFYSPAMMMGVRNGWLYAEGHSKKSKFLGAGFIHCLVKNRKYFRFCETYKCYCFFVSHYGWDYDLVCQACYIPQADNFISRYFTMKKIRRLLSLEDITKEDIFKEFPRLNDEKYTSSRSS